MEKIEFIKQLAELVKEKELEEITFEDKDISVTVKGRRCPPPPPMDIGMGMGIPMPMPVSAAGAAPMPAPVQQQQQTAADGNVVKAPLVGTFYAASAPDKPPFVTVGTQVKKGDILMIIESMKLMNEVQSDFDGVVSEILVSNGQAVEFDQPIMIIK